VFEWYKRFSEGREYVKKVRTPLFRHLNNSGGTEYGQRNGNTNSNMKKACAKMVKESASF
jgi:hypothetical protein